MSFPLPSDSANPPTVATPPVARKAHFSFKGRLSIFRQRLILRFRWFFRLPIDDLKDAQIVQQFDALFGVIEEQAKAINGMIQVMNGLTARLSLYEREIPRMRDLRRQFDLEQSGIKTKSNGHHENGILTLPESKIIHP